MFVHFSVVLFLFFIRGRGKEGGEGGRGEGLDHTLRGNVLGLGHQSNSQTSLPCIYLPQESPSQVNQQKGSNFLWSNKSNRYIF